MSSPSPVTPAERRRVLQRQEARRRILDATEALLVERGYDGFSMRRLARRCGYTAPTIYHYFGDKRSLLDAVVDERYERLLARSARRVRPADPLHTVRAILLEFERFGEEHPNHYRLLAMPRPPDAPVPQAAERVRALLEEPLAQLDGAGRLVAGGVEAALQFLWIVMHGLVSLRISRTDIEWSPILVEFAVDAALRGLVRVAGAEDAA